MHIWVDADACPQAMKTILFRAAERVGMSLSLVANRRLHVPRSPYLHAVSVRGGPDAADDHIVEHMGPGDLVITADIPLAARVVEKEGTALNPRGELYTEDNVSERLSVRDFMHDLRDSGVRTGGPAALSSAHKQAFANQLDKWLAQNAPKKKS